MLRPVIRSSHRVHRGFADDEVGRAFSELLIARHRDGIEVRVLDG